VPAVAVMARPAVPGSPGSSWARTPEHLSLSPQIRAAGGCATQGAADMQRHLRARRGTRNGRDTGLRMPTSVRPIAGLLRCERGTRGSMRRGSAGVSVERRGRGVRPRVRTSSTQSPAFSFVYTRLNSCTGAGPPLIPAAIRSAPHVCQTSCAAHARCCSGARLETPTSGQIQICVQMMTCRSRADCLSFRRCQTDCSMLPFISTGCHACLGKCSDSRLNSIDVLNLRPVGRSSPL
jgi:hypothetical protein